MGDRIVCSLTTLPGRYDRLRETLVSINKQNRKFDAIYLTLPKVTKRTGKVYPPLPEDLLGLCTIVPVEIDYGPICKIWGGLYMEDDPNTIIVTVDDDTTYLPDFAEKIIEKSNFFPTSVVCGTGAKLGRGAIWLSLISSLDFGRPLNGLLGFPVDPINGSLVDVGYGVGGVGYRRSFFPEKSKLYSDFVALGQDKPGLFLQDDVMISGYLSKKRIDIRVFLDMSLVHTSPGGEDSITPDLGAMYSGVAGAIKEGKEIGFFPSMQVPTPSNTLVGNLGTSVFFIVLMAVFAIAVWFLG